MRDILFRGKRVDNGEWVEGYYAGVAKNNIILTGRIDITETIGAEAFRIIPETVGQYTGLTDKNGRKIFEGDIVKRYYQSNVLFNVGVINWDSRSAWWACQLYTMNPCFSLYDENQVEIIGNIFDNPELLENNTGKENSI